MRLLPSACLRQPLFPAGISRPTLACLLLAWLAAPLIAWGQTASNDSAVVQYPFLRSTNDSRSQPRRRPRPLPRSTSQSPRSNPESQAPRWRFTPDPITYRNAPVQQTSFFSQVLGGTWPAPRPGAAPSRDDVGYQPPEPYADQGGAVADDRYDDVFDGNGGADYGPDHGPNHGPDFGHGSCADCGQGCCQPCCMPYNRFWIGADYLLWWIKGDAVPPLVTTSPASTPQTSAGVLGQPGTSVLFGGNNIGTGPYSGARIRAGYWCDPCQTHGIELIYFGLASQTTSFQASSPGDPILARPFYSVQPGATGQTSELVAYPGLLSGNISVSSTTSLQGAEALLRGNLYRTGSSRVDALIGWQYLQLNDSLYINDFKTVLNTNFGLPVGTTLTEYDQFKTRNTFNGILLGLDFQKCWGAWSLDGWAKLGLGNTYSQVTINGQAVSSVPSQGGPPTVTTTHAGLLAQSTNIGSYSSNQFAVVPQFGLTAGRMITARLRVNLGYSFLYWSSVQRAGEQIDTSLNLSQLSPTGLSGPARPQFPNAFTGLWAQGLNVGLDYRF